MKFKLKLNQPQASLQKYVIKVSKQLDVLQDVVKHHCSDPQSSVWIETAESHNIEASLVCNHVDSTADSADDDIVVVSEFRELS